MVFNFVNVALIVAMVIVSVAFGYRIGKKKWYMRGFHTGVDLTTEMANILIEEMKREHRKYGLQGAGKE